MFGIRHVFCSAVTGACIETADVVPTKFGLRPDPWREPLREAHSFEYVGHKQFIDGSGVVLVPAVKSDVPDPNGSVG